MADSGYPDPDRVADLAEFIEALNQLRLWAGGPSYRTLAKRVGSRLRPPQTVPHSTITAVFQPHRRRLDLDLVTAVVRALGLDEPDVARWRATCVRVHASAKAGGPLAVFRQLPPDLATFTGRRTELDRLIEAAGTASLAPTTIVVSAIEGMAGVGKTTLAVHAAHELVRAGRFADAQLYVNLRGFDADQPPTEPSAVLDAFLRQLGVPAAQIPVSLDERAAMFRDRLHGKKALVLLDNAAGEAQIRHLIPAEPTCLVLITSRQSLAGLAGAVTQPLGVLGPAESVDLLARIAGTDRVAAEAAAAEAIVEYCGRLPLALALAASRLRARPTWKLADLAERLHGGDLDTLRVGQHGIRAVFDLSFRDLPEHARRMFELLGLWAGRDIGTAAAAALAGRAVSEAGEALETLVDANMLESPSHGRYRFHDLLRRFAIDQAATVDPADRRAAVGRVLTWYQHAAGAAMDVIAPQRRPVQMAARLESTAPLPVLSGGAAAVAWCDTERANLVAATGMSFEHGFDDIAWQLPTSLQYYLHRSMRIEDFIGSHQTGLRATRRSGSLEGQIRLSHGLVGAYTIAGRLEEALAAAEANLTLCRKAGRDSDARAAMSSLAKICQQSGDGLRAVEVYREALEHERAAEDDYGIALVSNDLGVTYFNLGRHEEALACYEESLRIARSTGRLDGQAYTLHSLGELAAAQGDHARAVVCFEEAVQLLEETSNLMNQAEFLGHLSASYAALGDEARAREALARADATRAVRKPPEGAAFNRRGKAGSRQPAD